MTRNLRPRSHIFFPGLPRQSAQRSLCPARCHMSSGQSAPLFRCRKLLNKTGCGQWVALVTALSPEWLIGTQRLSAYIKPGDLVVTGPGTSQFGFNMTTLPHGAKVWTQAVYGSIGYAAGASIAARETGTYKRVILITGEGSLQLTVQAFSILNRHGITPVV